MSDVIFTTPPQPPVGTFPGIVTYVAVEDIETAEGTKALVKWRATITDAKGNDYEVDALSSLNFGARSKAKRWATALGVTDPEVGADALVGQAGLFVMGEADDGYVRLVDIVAPVSA